MKETYLICNKKISVEAPRFLPTGGYWRLFLTNGGEPDVTVVCEECEKLPSFKAEPCFTSSDVSVSVLGGKVFRAYSLGTVKSALSVYEPFGAPASKTYILSRNYGVALDDRYLWQSLALSQLLLKKDVLLIHASYIEYKGKAILFSAPCGVGKSTQADLWQKHLGAEIINGDKAALSFEKNGVLACSLPFCGTSGICKNKTLTLGALVLLGRGKVNSAKKLGGASAVLEIMKNIYLDFAAPGEQQRCVELLIELLNSVPVLGFECSSPDENAVAALKNALEENGAF